MIGLIRPIWNGLGPVLEHGLGHAPLVVWGSGLVAAPALTTRLRDHPATVSWQPTLSNRHVSSPKEVAQLDGRRAAHWFMRSMIMCCLLASPGRPLRRICGARTSVRDRDDGWGSRCAVTDRKCRTRTGSSWRGRTLICAVSERNGVVQRARSGAGSFALTRRMVRLRSRLRRYAHRYPVHRRRSSASCHSRCRSPTQDGDVGGVLRSRAPR